MHQPPATVPRTSCARPEEGHNPTPHNHVVPCALTAVPCAPPTPSSLSLHPPLCLCTLYMHNLRPFVMNSREEILQAYMDYSAGKLQDPNDDVWAAS